MQSVLTNAQIITLLCTDWVVEICGDLGRKSKERITYPVEFHILGNDVHLRNSMSNMISFKVDKSFSVMRQAFYHIIRWETEGKLYQNGLGPHGKMFKNRWEGILISRYLFYKIMGKNIVFPNGAHVETPQAQQMMPRNDVYTIPLPPSSPLPPIPQQMNQSVAQVQTSNVEQALPVVEQVAQVQTSNVEQALPVVKQVAQVQTSNVEQALPVVEQVAQVGNVYQTPSEIPIVPQAPRLDSLTGLTDDKNDNN
jgi:hypothetical protein